MFENINVIFINFAEVSCAEMFVMVIYKCSVSCHSEHKWGDFFEVESYPFADVLGQLFLLRHKFLVEGI